MQAFEKYQANKPFAPLVGVGLRHPHFSDALASVAPVDFVEVHSENYFAEGGATLAVLRDITQKYPVSLHSTALGLGSAGTIPAHYMQKLKSLINQVKPILVSDHASFSWGSWQQRPVHAGDLLPISFTEESLKTLAENVDQVQQFLGRQLLIENLSAYIQFDYNSMSETEFLVRLTELSGCGLLLDLNNILVNAHNQRLTEPLYYANQWLNQIPTHVVGEIHLAGHSSVAFGELAIDDHSHPVSSNGWQLYFCALKRFGAVPTLIEWDNELPAWDVLIDEVKKARIVADRVMPQRIAAL